MAQTSTEKQELSADELGALPRWDLADLYPGRDSAELKRDLDGSTAGAAAFRRRYETKLAALSGPALAEAVAEYEGLQETLGRIMSYAYLVYAGNMTDAEIGGFFQNMQEKVNAISTELLFFTLEMNRIEDAALAEKLKSRELAHYEPWLRDLRAFRPHQLGDDLEKLLHEKYVAGRAAWTRLFDETMAALRFPIDGKDMTWGWAAGNSASSRSTARATSMTRYSWRKW